MAYSIQDRLHLEVLFDNVALPFSQTFQLGYLHISNARRLKVPYLSLSVTDTQQWLVANKLLGDGVKITVKLRVGADATAQTRTYKFTLTFVNTPAEGSTTYVIEAVLDHLRFLAGTSNKAVTGTSSQALQAVADACGLTHDLVSTNDTQTWLPSNRRFSDFAHYVAEHGYTKEDGCLRLALDLKGTLIYRDITSMDKPLATFGLMDTTTPNVFTVTSFRPVLSSGAGNVLSGYSMSTVEQTPFKDIHHTRQESVSTVINEQGALTVSATDKAKVMDGTVKYAPIDSGNAHDKFIRARHQNLRVANLFSSFLEIVTPQPTDLRPLDTVEVSADVLRSDGDSATDATAYAGTYRISDHVIYVVPGHYVEKFILMRRTLGVDSAKSLPVGSTTHAPLQTDLPQKVTSTLNVPVFSPAALESALESFASQATSSLTSLLSGVSSAVSSSGSAMSDPATNITDKISTVSAAMTGIANPWIASITAHVASEPPLSDPGHATWLTTLNTMVTDAKAAVALKLTQESPELARIASRANAMATVAFSVNAAASSLASVLGSTSASNQMSNAMSKLAKVINTAEAAAEAISGAASAAAAAGNLGTSVASATAPLNAQANTLLNDAATYVTQMNAVKTSLNASIDAAAVH